MMVRESLEEQHLCDEREEREWSLILPVRTAEWRMCRSLSCATWVRRGDAGKRISFM